MQTRRENGNQWVMRIERGEQVIESMKEWCEEEGISGGFFLGLGAVDEVELGHYDVETQAYSKKVFEEAFEVMNLSGSIGISDEVIVHAHIVLGNKEMAALGGHLVEARVSGTMEIMVWVTGEIRKVHEEVTGLKVFQLVR